MYSQEEVPIVIDNGSGQFKAGFSGQPSPSVVFSSVVGGFQTNLVSVMVSDFGSQLTVDVKLSHCDRNQNMFL